MNEVGQNNWVALAIWRQAVAGGLVGAKKTMFLGSLANFLISFFSFVSSLAMPFFSRSSCLPANQSFQRFRRSNYLVAAKERK